MSFHLGLKWLSRQWDRKRNVPCWIWGFKRPKSDGGGWAWEYYTTEWKQVIPSRTKSLGTNIILSLWYLQGICPPATWDSVADTDNIEFDDENNDYQASSFSLTNQLHLPISCSHLALLQSSSATRMPADIRNCKRARPAARTLTERQQRQPGFKCLVI